MRLIVLAIAAALAIQSFAFCAKDFIQIGKEKDEEWQKPRPDKPDLSVTYIKRLPRYPGNPCKYEHIQEPPGGNDGDLLPPTITNPGAQKWPKPGETVTFHAHVKNKGPVPVKNYDWHWLIDGKDVESGIGKEIRLNEEHVYGLEWKWRDGPHFVSFEVDRRRLLDEITRNNNFVVDQTNALAFHFFVEESVYSWFDTVKGGLDSYCWEDWAQMQVREMNRMFRDSIFPSQPNGITERVRLDEVTIIPDGWGTKGGMHVPFAKTPVNYDNPEFVDGNAEYKDGKAVCYGNGTGGIDGVWGFSKDLLKPRENGLHFYSDNPRWLTAPEWPLHHELGHQLGRADHYLVPVDGKNNKVAPGIGHEPPKIFRQCMMAWGNYAHDDNIGKHGKKWDCTYRFYDEFTAASYSRDQGVRRGMFGEYVIDVPKKNTFTFYLQDGTPLGDDAVALHRSVGRGYSQGFFSPKAAYAGWTNSKGEWTLTKPVYDVQLNWLSNAALFFLVETKHGEKYGGTTDVSELNLEYWRGNQDDAHIAIIVRPVPEPEDSGEENQ